MESIAKLLKVITEGIITIFILVFIIYGGIMLAVKSVDALLGIVL